MNISLDCENELRTVRSVARQPGVNELTIVREKSEGGSVMVVVEVFLVQSGKIVLYVRFSSQVEGELLFKRCIRADIHGTTFSHATSLRQAYGMT